MICDAAAFSQAMKDLDIRKSDETVCYDTNGLMIGASRAYWIFRVYGLNVKILRQPLGVWAQEGHPTSTGADISPQNRREPPESDSVYDFTRVNPHLIFRYEELASNQIPLLDARPPQVVAQGTVPGATSMPFVSFIDQENGGFRDTQVIKETIEAVSGLDAKQPIVTTCMRGMTASVLFAALEEVGNKNVRMYDGSFTEFMSRNNA